MFTFKSFGLEGRQFKPTADKTNHNLAASVCKNFIFWIPIKTLMKIKLYHLLILSNGRTHQNYMGSHLRAADFMSFLLLINQKANLKTRIRRNIDYEVDEKKLQYWLWWAHKEIKGMPGLLAHQRGNNTSTSMQQTHTNTSVNISTYKYKNGMAEKCNSTSKVGKYFVIL